MLNYYSGLVKNYEHFYDPEFLGTDVLTAETAVYLDQTFGNANTLKGNKILKVCVYRTDFKCQ